MTGFPRIPISRPTRPRRKLPISLNHVDLQVGTSNGQMVSLKGFSTKKSAQTDISKTNSSPAERSTKERRQSMWSEWNPADIVSEQELLNRAILQKCWIAYTSHGTAHFN